MQRINHDKYQVGYAVSNQFYFHMVTAFLAAIPACEITRLVMGEVAEDSTEIFYLLIAILSLGGNWIHASTHYGAATVSALNDKFEYTSNYSNRVIRERFSLFSSSEQVNSAHRKSQVCVSMIAAALTVLYYADSSSLSRSQESVAGAFITTALIVAGEVMLDAINKHFGADVVDVEFRPQHARPSI